MKISRNASSGQRQAESGERPFGPSGPAVSIVGQGTWQLERNERSAIRALRRGVELGLRHIDTAEIYGGGAVESLVGRTLGGLRDQVFLVSKVNPRRATRAGLVRACEESLRRLRTDRLDGYLLHWLPPHPLGFAVEALETLADAGKIGVWGVSNFDEVKLEELMRLAEPGRVACNQVLYHLEERAVEHAVIPFCRRHGIALVAYSPFAVGSFPGPDSPGGRVLATIARSHGASPRQVALRFLTREPGSFVIPRSSDVAHVEDNAAAMKLRLDEAEVRAIDRAFPRGEQRSGVPML